MTWQEVPSLCIWTTSKSNWEFSNFRPTVYLALVETCAQSSMHSLPQYMFCPAIAWRAYAPLTSSGIRIVPCTFVPLYQDVEALTKYNVENFEWTWKLKNEITTPGSIIITSQNNNNNNNNSSCHNANTMWPWSLQSVNWCFLSRLYIKLWFDCSNQGWMCCTEAWTVQCTT